MQKAVNACLVLVGFAGCTSGGGATPDGAGGGGGPFPLDCSMTANQMTPHCARPSMVPAGSIGSGQPTIDTGYGTLDGGFVDGNRLIASVEYSSSQATGYVLAVDLVTGDRTIVSGTYNDSSNNRQTVGTGPDWGMVNDVQPGPDGWYALTSVGVFRIDPATGTRTLVVDSANTATRCTVGSQHVIPRSDSLAVGSDGTVYLVLSNNPAGTGVGAVAVHNGACRIVSLGGGPSGSDVGSGATMISGYFRTLRFHSGALWAEEFQSQSLMKIDPTTGARQRLSSSGTMPVGTGDPGVGDGWFDFANGTSNVYTTKYDGLNQMLILTVVDPTTGNRTGIELKSGPANKGGETYPPLWVHPTMQWLLVGLDNAIVEVDIATGLSYTLSR